MDGQQTLSRRVALAGGGALIAVSLAPAGAAADAMENAIREWTGGAKVNEGRVALDVAPLVENGNSVALNVAAGEALTPERHVSAIAVFNEKNPQPLVAVFHLGPRTGRASVSTRIRLADSQRITAIARMNDGSYWSDSADVIVTLAACIEN